MWRYCTRSRRRQLGWAFVAFGMLAWAVSLTVTLGARGNHDVSISYFEERSLGVIAGGASIAGGIILIALAA